MNLFKRLFGRDDAHPQQPASGRPQPTYAIEDVRSNQSEEGEVIVNLWYVTNRIVISSLRAKAYIASGSDDEKTHFLRARAIRDWTSAQVFPVPESVKVEVKLVDGSSSISTGKACTHATLELMGGYPALFREIMLGIPKTSFRFDLTKALMCITGLEEGPNGQLSVRNANYTKL